MDNELHQLCKEVYEKTGWWNVSISHMWSGKETTDFKTPLYTSDYLLEKLKPFLNAERKSLSFRFADNVFWLDADDIYNGPRLSVIQADTPLKALLKLTIALHEAGEANK